VSGEDATKATSGAGAGDGSSSFRHLRPIEPAGPATSAPGSSRETTAAALVDLAARAAAPAVEEFGLADQCLRDALVLNPDQPEARRLMGHVRRGESWVTPAAARKLDAHEVLDPTYGWVPDDWPPHLNQGELPAPIVAGRPVAWLPRERADALRSDIKKRPWEIRSENFLVRTNVPLGEAIAFGRRLEVVRDAFLSLFADIFEPEDLPLARRYRGLEPLDDRDRRHEVWYFAEKPQYVEFLRRNFGRDESAGLAYYMPKSEASRFRQPPRAFFYRDPDNPIEVTATLHHEASHQVLFESSGEAARHMANAGHFWVWEGLGTYFETLRAEPDGVGHRIGGRYGPRMTRAAQDARAGRFLPVAELTALGESRFFDEVDVYRNYAQAMALTVFLMHGDEGRHRDAFVAYVADAYRGRYRAGATLPGLAQRLGMGPSELDRRLVAYLSPP
jgi:hypothetical protein